MKKSLAALVIFVLCLTLSLCTLAESAGKVEIAFKIGDSVLTINGVETEVETPYVVDGTTLVPLRVITEAFGSQVDWEGSTKTITLTYPDVNIVMQIGNKNVTVNSHTEELLQAPALSASGVTMVPLRFISETFGAEVGFNDETKAITVVKEAAAEEDNTLHGMTELERIGDSHYLWSMDTPSAMFMQDRSFDGLNTSFVNNSDKSTLNVLVYPYDPDINYDTQYADNKDSFKNMTLTKADRVTDDKGNKGGHFRAKDKAIIIDYLFYMGEKYNYLVIGTSPVENTNVQALYDIIDSFKLDFGSYSQTYNLSNVDADGNRLFSDEKYNFSVKLPADWWDNSNGAENEFQLNKISLDSSDYISIGIYSKNENVTADILAKKDRESNSEYYNTEYCMTSDVMSIKINKNISGVYYTQELSLSDEKTMYLTDVFFDLGDYVYNFAFHLFEKNDQLVNAAISSITAKELDSDKIGLILRNDLENSTYTTSNSSWELTLPSAWEEQSSSVTGAFYYHLKTGTALGVNVTKADGATVSEIQAAVVKLYGSLRDKYTVLDGVSTLEVGNISFSYFTYIETTGDETYYCTEYYALRDDKIYCFEEIAPKCCHDGPIDSEVQDIIKTLVSK